MNTILKLDDLYVSDFIAINDNEKREKFSLDLVMDDKIGAPRLAIQPPPNKMWGKYWYRSGTNNSMTNELKSIVEEITSRIKYKNRDIWLDIACNDGTLLKFVPKEFVKLGIDPADDSFLKESKKVSDVIIQDYFSLENYKKTGYGNQKAKVITTIAMFYDLSDTEKFLKDINEVLDDNGIWIIQLSYTPLMIKQLAFDNICHEHCYYYSLNSIKKLIDNHNLEIVDANINDTNGGSIRIYIQKKNRDITSFTSAPMRDVCNFRAEAILNYENSNIDISNPSVWKEFGERIKTLKDQIRNFIIDEKSKGKIICGYGASTKGNTLLQLFELDHTLIDCIAERSPYKYGLKTVGTNIPIVSEEEVRAKNPDYLLILPWHFVTEFIKREKDFLDKGGKFIVPCPKLEIIGKR